MNTKPTTQRKPFLSLLVLGAVLVEAQTAFGGASARRRLCVRLAAVVLLAVAATAWAQVSGDYRSKGSGDWNTAGTWETYDGSTWGNASGAPGSGNSVYIQSGHTVTLTESEACNDLHISTGTTSASSGAEGKVALSTFTLSINGKLRCYYAPVGTIAGTPSNAGYSSYPFTASSGGKISVVGNSRNLTVSSEWSGTITTPSAGAFPLEINLTAGQTATMNTSIKATSVTVNSGTLDAAGSYRLAVDNDLPGQGDVTINSGAVLSSAQSGTGDGSQVMSRTGSSRAGTLTVASGGRLILSGGTPCLDMNSIVLNGTVEYSKSAVQTLAKKSGRDASAADPSTYSDLILNGTSAKTLGLNTTVNGTLTLAGTASLALGSFTLTYGASSTLEYAGSAAQATTDTEFPSSGGPDSLKINNANGVSLNGSKTVNGTLTFSAGKIATGGNTLGLGTSATVSGAGTGKYVYGNLQKSFGTGSGQSLTLEIGDSTSYTPVTLANLTVTTAGTLTANTTGSEHSQFAGSGLLASKSVNRYWTLTAGGGLVASTYDVTFTFINPGDVDSGANTSAFLVRRYSGSAWSGTTPGTRTTTSTQATGLSAFSDFVIGEFDPTRVVLYDFQLGTRNGQVVVRWQTASEVSTLGFQLYRQTGPGAWTPVGGFIASQGQAQGGVGAAYAVLDAGAQVGQTYTYKLVEEETTGGTQEYGPFVRTAQELELVAPLSVEGGQVVVRWLSRAGEIYSVQQCTDLATGVFVPVATDLAATPPLNSITGRVDQACTFFRILVQ